MEKEYSKRENDILDKLARKLSRASKRGSGTLLTADEVGIFTKAGATRRVFECQATAVEEMWEERRAAQDLERQKRPPPKKIDPPKGKPISEEAQAERDLARRILNKPRPPKAG